MTIKYFKENKIISNFLDEQGEGVDLLVDG